MGFLEILQRQSIIFKFLIDTAYTMNCVDVLWMIVTEDFTADL